MDPYGYLAAMDASGEAYDPKMYSLQRDRQLGRDLSERAGRENLGKWFSCHI